MELHVLVVPPAMFEGQNLEQEFNVLINPELANVQPNGQVAYAWIGPLLSIRVKQLNERGEPMTDAQKMATETGRRIMIAAAAMKVPIVFFYEPAWLMIELENPCTGDV